MFNNYQVGNGMSELLLKKGGDLVVGTWFHFIGVNLISCNAKLK